MLRFRLTVVLPRVDADLRPTLNALKPEIVRIMRRHLNRERNRVRAASPFRSGRLRRNVRVQRVRAELPNSISMELQVRVFYAGPTNARGSSRGWYSRLEVAETVTPLVRASLGAAITPIVLQTLARQGLRDLGRAFEAAGVGIAGVVRAGVRGGLPGSSITLKLLQ